MASAALGDELSCSICLNLYTEPVSLRCGHNFCQDCIVNALDTQEGYGVYTCPECREESVERPTMEKNRKLCNIVEHFRSTQPKEEKSEIFCTYCLDSPAAAIKTCVHCETSMCGKHLTAHNKTVDHVLMEPTTSFRSKKYSLHKKLLEYYCTEDDACLCASCCLVGRPKGHEVEPLQDASEKEKLRGVLEKLTMKRKATEQNILTLEDHQRKIKTKEDYEKKRVAAMFEDSRRQLEVQEQKVLRDISRHGEAISLSVTDHIEQLEMQKDELFKKICHIEKICNMIDPITALQDQVSDSDEALQDQVSVSDEALQDQVSDSDEALQDQVSDSDEALQDQVSDSDEALQDQVPDTDEALQDQVSDSDEALQDQVSDSDEALQDQVSGIDEALQDQVSGIDEALQDQVSDSDEALQDQVSGTDEALQDQVSDSDEALQDQVSDSDEALQDQVSDSDEALQDQVSDSDEVLQDQVSDSDEVLQDQVSDSD